MFGSLDRRGMDSVVIIEDNEETSSFFRHNPRPSSPGIRLRGLHGTRGNCGAMVGDILIVR